MRKNSTTSLDHTEQLKRQYSLTNLELRQLPIENVATLGRRFDLIVCTGVLHHLVDPDAGLRALRSVLGPEGAMNLMVYAPYGRTGVYMLQDYCRRLGIGTSEREIDDLIAGLKVLPQHHPLAALLRGSRDSANATLAWHAREYVPVRLPGTLYASRSVCLQAPPLCS